MNATDKLVATLGMSGLPRRYSNLYSDEFGERFAPSRKTDNYSWDKLCEALGVEPLPEPTELNPSHYLQCLETIRETDHPYYVLVSGSLPTDIYNNDEVIQAFREFLEREEALLDVYTSPIIMVDNETAQNKFLSLLFNKLEEFLGEKVNFWVLRERLAFHPHVTTKGAVFHYQHSEYERERIEIRIREKDKLAVIAKSIQSLRDDLKKSGGIVSLGNKNDLLKYCSFWKEDFFKFTRAMMDMVA